MRSTSVKMGQCVVKMGICVVNMGSMCGPDGVLGRVASPLDLHAARVEIVLPDPGNEAHAIDVDRTTHSLWRPLQ